MFNNCLRLFFSKKSIPILLYHQLDYRKSRLSVTPEEFEAHLKIIKGLGFFTIFIEEMEGVFEKTQQRDNRAIAIAFDDGHVSNWFYAYPILKKYSMKATLFIVTSWVLNKNRRYNNGQALQNKADYRALRLAMEYEEENGRAFVSWEELSEMQESGLIDIQPHGHRHFFFDGKQLYQEEKLVSSSRQLALTLLYDDIATAKSLIEEKLHKRCVCFAWPGGGYSKEAIAIVKKLGFIYSVSIELGANTAFTDRYALRRITVKNYFASPLKFIFFFWLFSNNTLKFFKNMIFRKRRKEE